MKKEYSYCACANPKSVKVTIMHDTHSVCSKRLGGCGHEISHVAKTEKTDYIWRQTVDTVNKDADQFMAMIRDMADEHYQEWYEEEFGV